MIGDDQPTELAAGVGTAGARPVNSPRRRLPPLLAIWLALLLINVALMTGCIIHDATGVGDSLALYYLPLLPIFGALQLPVALIHAVRVAREGSWLVATLIAIVALGLFAVPIWLIWLILASM